MAQVEQDIQQTFREYWSKSFIMYIHILLHFFFLVVYISTHIANDFYISLLNINSSSFIYLFLFLNPNHYSLTVVLCVDPKKAVVGGFFFFFFNLCTACWILILEFSKSVHSFTYYREIVVNKHSDANIFLIEVLF